MNVICSPIKYLIFLKNTEILVQKYVKIFTEFLALIIEFSVKNAVIYTPKSVKKLIFFNSAKL
jgi:hypothetical protein